MALTKITGSQGTFTDFVSTGIDDNATSTAITIDSSEKVGIGETSPAVPLHITNTLADQIKLQTDSTTTGPNIVFANNDGNLARIASAETNVLRFEYGPSNTEAMRIISNGNLLHGKTSAGQGVQGIELEGGNGALLTTRTSDLPLLVNRLGSDGKLVSLRHASSEEGNISVSGGTVSYNGFTGTHWSRFTDNSTPTILKGTVLETLDEMCDWYNLEFDVTDADGNTHTEKVPHVLTDTQSNGDVITYNHEGTDYQATIVKETDIKHVKSKVSDTVDAKNVYGVFVAYDLDDEGYNDFYVASVGTFVVRIKANETIAKGDLLQSNGDGTAKVQTGDAVKSSSFAKVLSTTVIETYDDGSFIVPCSLMC